MFVVYRAAVRALAPFRLYRYRIFRHAKALVVPLLGGRIATVDGHRFYPDPTDATGLYSGIPEPAETELVKATVGPGDVVVDVGAHVGYYTLLLARVVGEHGHVFAFEPDPDNFALLEKNVALNGYTNVTLSDLAVSDRTGTVKLYRSLKNRGDNRIYNSGDSRTAIEVEAVRLDKYFGDQERAIDFLKMDIQGAEPLAVEGMGGLFGRRPPARMLIEFWPWGIGRAGRDPTSLLIRLQEAGYALHEVTGTSPGLRAVDSPKALAAIGEREDDAISLFCTRSGESRRR